jgi:hypothetical protein
MGEDGLWPVNPPLSTTYAGVSRHYSLQFAMMYQAQIEMHDGRRFKARANVRESDARASIRQEVRKPGVHLVLLRDLTTREIICITDARSILPATPTLPPQNPPAGEVCLLHNFAKLARLVEGEPALVSQRNLAVMQGAASPGSSASRPPSLLRGRPWWRITLRRRR